MSDGDTHPPCVSATWPCLRIPQVFRAELPCKDSQVHPATVCLKCDVGVRQAQTGKMCMICDVEGSKLFPSNKSLLRHLEMEHGKFLCEICLKVEDARQLFHIPWDL